MRNLKAALLATILVACNVGSESPAPAEDTITYVDTDGDGVADGVDTDGDGDADRSFQTPDGSVPCGGAPICDEPLVDSDGDDWADGIDVDCDGDIDIPFTDDDGGTHDTGNVCTVTVSDGTQKKQVSCENGQCECRIDDALVKTCTDNGQSCSVPGSCCGF